MRAAACGRKHSHFAYDDQSSADCKTWRQLRRHIVGMRDALSLVYITGPAAVRKPTCSKTPAAYFEPARRLPAVLVQRVDKHHLRSLPLATRLIIERPARVRGSD